MFPAQLAVAERQLAHQRLALITADIAQKEHIVQQPAFLPQLLDALVAEAFDIEGAAADEMLEALEGVSIFRTDTDGAVKITAAADGLRIKTYKDFMLERTRECAGEMRNLRRLCQTW